MLLWNFLFLGLYSYSFRSPEHQILLPITFILRLRVLWLSGMAMIIAGVWAQKYCWPWGSFPSLTLFPSSSPSSGSLSKRVPTGCGLALTDICYHKGPTCFLVPCSWALSTPTPEPESWNGMVENGWWLGLCLPLMPSPFPSFYPNSPHSSKLN